MGRDVVGGRKGIPTHIGTNRYSLLVSRIFQQRNGCGPSPTESTLAADRRSHPGNDLISVIAADSDLELDDVVTTAIACHETTANLLDSAMIASHLSV
ncbi:hypothetical protein [Mycobacterium intracellulare]|uniref:hypothetical protein n=1 Tax=Mycobacterium intracellulare TaxID=1767 RepID=UPI00080BDDAE|nr:hypothetical protein [Mycobacterium intracellulare]OCB11747.1 hypothetical protein A5644_03400 [Mycobacterium intracellulare subsp. yongonense]